MNDEMLLKEECRARNCAFVDIDSIFPKFYYYLNSVLRKKPHENIEQVHGCIFARSHDFQPPTKMLARSYDFGSDGRLIFDLIIQDKPESSEVHGTVIFDHELSQQELLSLATNPAAIILVKTAGSLRIYHYGTIYLIEGRNWRIYKRIDEYVDRVQQHFPELDTRQFTRVLSFAFHELSLNKIGTTIVYHLRTDKNLPGTTKSKLSELDFSDNSQLLLLKNFLTYNDGAVAINLVGKVFLTNIFLDSSPLAHKHIKSLSGTRHTSAAKYSFDNQASIIITVSADGPVSLFSEGFNIENLNSSINYQANDGIHKMAKEIDNPSWEEEVIAGCPTCGRNYLVNVLTVAGWRDRETLDCDVCGTEYFSKSCMRLQHRLIKKLT